MCKMVCAPFQRYCEKNINFDVSTIYQGKISVQEWLVSLTNPDKLFEEIKDKNLANKKQKVIIFLFAL